jgi:hypothetical protein
MYNHHMSHGGRLLELKKDAMLSVRLSRQLYDDIKAEAAETHVSMAAYIRGVLSRQIHGKKTLEIPGEAAHADSSSQRAAEEQNEATADLRSPPSLGTMRSPRQSLTFQQLEIYYAGQKQKNNGELLAPPDLVDGDGRYNYAAYLLADENSVSIKVAKYATTTKAKLIEYEEYGYRCLITAAQRVLEKLRVENKTFAIITPEGRLEKQMIDGLALKDAFINAIANTDFTSGVAPVVEIFQDRLAITSYGGLPLGMSRENWFSGHAMPRNRELLRVFQDIGLMEQPGFGASRILEAYGPSAFSFDGDFMIITFPFAERF